MVRILTSVYILGNSFLQVHISCLCFCGIFTVPWCSSLKFVIVILAVIWSSQSPVIASLSPFLGIKLARNCWCLVEHEKWQPPSPLPCAVGVGGTLVEIAGCHLNCIFFQVDTVPILRHDWDSGNLLIYVSNILLKYNRFCEYDHVWGWELKLLNEFHFQSKSWLLTFLKIIN